MCRISVAMYSKCCNTVNTGGRGFIWLVHCFGAGGDSNPWTTWSEIEFSTCEPNLKFLLLICLSSSSFPFISSLSFNFYPLPSLLYPVFSFSFLSFILFFSFPPLSFLPSHFLRFHEKHQPTRRVTRRALEVRSRRRGHTRHVSKAHRLKRSQRTGGTRRGTHLHPPDAEGWLRRLWEPSHWGEESENWCQIIVRRITSAHGGLKNYRTRTNNESPRAYLS